MATYNEELAHFLAKELSKQIDLCIVTDCGGDTSRITVMKEIHLEKLIRKFLDKRTEEMLGESSSRL